MTDAEWERRNAGPSRLPVRADHYAEDVCRIIAREAHRRTLPPDFLARLIWRESLFEPNAVSPKGAQGIAQFMPGTRASAVLQIPWCRTKPCRPRRICSRICAIASAISASRPPPTMPAPVLSPIGGPAIANCPSRRKIMSSSLPAGRPPTGQDSTADHAIPAIGPAGDFHSSCLKLVRAS